MATPPDRKRSVGARSIGDEDRRKGGGWWKWLLGLLLLAALVALAITLLGGGDDDDGKTKTASTPTTATSTPTTATSTPSASTPAAATPPATGDGGTLVAAGTSLLPVPADGFKALAGEDATGSRNKVLSVVDSGFFVGTSEQDRVFVEYGSAVGADEDKQTYKAKVGDIVDLTGPVRPAPEDPATTFKLESADAAALTKQGAYVNATTVKLAS